MRRNTFRLGTHSVGNGFVYSHVVVNEQFMSVYGKIKTASMQSTRRFSFCRLLYLCKISVLNTVLKLDIDVLIEICCQFLYGVLFIVIRNMAVNPCRDIYVAMPHQAACIQ